MSRYLGRQIHSQYPVYACAFMLSRSRLLKKALEMRHATLLLKVTFESIFVPTPNQVRMNPCPAKRIAREEVTVRGTVIIPQKVYDLHHYFNHHDCLVSVLASGIGCAAHRAQKIKKT